MSDPVVELRNVFFRTQNEGIIEDFSCRFEEGMTTALAGPSGGGKSTVLKLAAGLLVPSSGLVLYRGKDISGMNRPQNLSFRREAAVVFQDSALWANQSISQILELPLRIHYPKMPQGERGRRIREITSLVGYRKSMDLRPASLSMGEQKLVGFARAMLCRPSLLFLDEWTESLDDDAARRLVALVRQFRAEGKTVVFISHDLELVTSLSDYVIMVTGGRKVMDLRRDQISDSALAAHLAEDGTS